MCYDRDNGEHFRYPTSLPDRIIDDADEIGLLMNALGACRPGARERAALELCASMIQHRLEWWRFLETAFEHTLDIAELEVLLSDWCPRKERGQNKVYMDPTGFCPSDKLTPSEIVRQSLEGKATIHPLAMSAQVILVVEVDDCRTSCLGGYAFLANSFLVILVNKETPRIRQIWTIVGYLLQALSSLFADSKGKADPPVAAVNTAIEPDNIESVIASIRNDCLSGDCERDRTVDAEYFASQLGCHRQTAQLAIDALVDEKTLEPANDPDTFRVFSLPPELFGGAIGCRLALEERAMKNIAHSEEETLRRYGRDLMNIVRRGFDALHAKGAWFTALGWSRDSNHALADHGHEFHERIATLGLTESERLELKQRRLQMMLTLPKTEYGNRAMNILHEHACIVEAMQSGDEHLLSWALRYHLIVPCLIWYPQHVAIMQSFLEEATR